jgi:hypothetical protein
LDIETGYARFELSDQEKSKTLRRKLFISFHESERRSIARDHFSYRFRDHTPSCGSDLSIRKTKEALAYVEKGRAKGKVIVKMR